MGGGGEGGCQASGYLKYWSYGHYLSLSLSLFSDGGSTEHNMSCLLCLLLM